MKKSILPILAGLAGILAFFLFSGLECNNKDPEDPNTHCLYFRSFKITWRPTPIDNLDRALEPAEHYAGITGNLRNYIYRPNGKIEKVCTGEAVVFDFLVEIKEEFKDDFVVLGYIEGRGDAGYVNNWQHSTANEVYTSYSSTTLPGSTSKVEEVLDISILVGYVGNSEYPDQVFNNVINRIQIDWAYTEY
jgi:hypothetical protein